MSEKDDAPTDGLAAPTPEEEGKAKDDSGNDPTLRGLSDRLRREVEKTTELSGKLAKYLASEPDGDDKSAENEKLKRENQAYKKAMEYPDIAPVIRGAIEKGVDPSFIDDDFVAAVRSASKTNTATSDEDVETPLHNPQRATPRGQPGDSLKGLSPEAFWGSE